MTTHHRDQIGGAAFGLLVGAIAPGVGYMLADKLDQPLYLWIGCGVSALTVAYFWWTLLDTLAASADYLKTIADQQTAALARKGLAPKATTDAQLMRKLGKAIEDE